MARTPARSDADAKHPVVRSAWATLNEADESELMGVFKEYGPQVARAVAREILRRRAAHALPPSIAGFADMVRSTRDEARRPWFVRLWHRLAGEPRGCLGL